MPEARTMVPYQACVEKASRLRPIIWLRQRGDYRRIPRAILTGSAVDSAIESTDTMRFQEQSAANRFASGRLEPDTETDMSLILN